MLPVMYERLSNFCYFCGHFEHLIRDCAAFELAKVEKGASVRIDYAPWIHVAIDHNKMVGRNASPENDDLLLETSGPKLASQRDKHDQNGEGHSLDIVEEILNCFSGDKVSYNSGESRSIFVGLQVKGQRGDNGFSSCNRL